MNNPLDKDTAVKIQTPYTEDQAKYISFLQYRLEESRLQRQTPLAHLNNKTLLQYYEENEKLANTWLPEKKTPDQVVISAGTIESKLDVILSSINAYDYTPELQAFDEDDNYQAEFCHAIDEIMAVCEENDGADNVGDEEKKILRQRELLKQGTVFVQEEWITKKELKSKKIKDYKGQFNVEKSFLNKTLEKVFEGPCREIIRSENMYLGNIYEFYMEKQPYIFSTYYCDYNTAKSKYGEFENFKYVVPGQNLDNRNQSKSMFDNSWTLNTLRENQCEIIMYQDQFNDEFQILINGVLMLPIGFGLCNVSSGGKYNIAKQILKPINIDFAYGKSFVTFGAIQQVASLLDEMYKLLVLKTRKSITAPYLNLSGKQVSNDVLSAGRITMGISPGSLVPLGQEGQGVTPSEYNMLELLGTTIDKNTVSPQFAGQQGKSGTTATEVVELQKQAKLTLGNIVASCIMLEKKLAYLRFFNIMENWFEPVNEVEYLDSERKSLEKYNTYRNSSRKTFIDGRGQGVKKIVISDGVMPQGPQIRDEENMLEQENGLPVQVTYINAEKIKDIKYKYFFNVIPREKENSGHHKLIVRELINDLMGMMNMGVKPNMQEVEQMFARAWQRPVDKLFINGQQGQSPSQPDLASGQFDGSQPKGLPNMSGMPETLALNS